MKCKECDGTGAVEFTVERGGPCCNNCNGDGRLTKRLLRIYLAAFFDHPNVYMSGPSEHAFRKADRFIDSSLYWFEDDEPISKKMHSQES